MFSLYKLLHLQYILSFNLGHHQVVKIVLNKLRLSWFVVVQNGPNVQDLLLLGCRLIKS